MIWMISDFIVVLLSMSLLGTFLFIITLIIQKYFVEYIWMRWIYNYMKVIMLFFIAPAIIMVAHIYMNSTINKSILIQGVDFTKGTINEMKTLKMLIAYENGQYGIFAIVFIAWFVGFVLVYFVNLCKSKIILAKILRNSILFNDETIEAIMKKAMYAMKIKKPIPIYRNNIITSPFLTGIIHPKLYLPNMKMKDSVLEIILKHELTHYKSHDLFYKQIVMFVQGFYWFNPFIYSFSKSFYLYSEIACDESILMGVADEERKEYAHTIISMLETAVIAPEVLGLSNNNVDFIQRRLYYIMKKKTKIKKVIITMMMVLVVSVCPLTAYASIASMTVIQDWMVRNQIDKNSFEEESKQIGKFIEQTEQLNSSGFAKQSTILGTATKGANLIDQDLYGKERLLIESIDFSKGSTIQFVLSGINNSDKFRAGTMNEKGIVKYVSSSNGSIQHTFTIPSAGIYDIFIESTTSSDIHITGSIYIK